MYSASHIFCISHPLQVFDFKLRHMRDVMTAIEASNNSRSRAA
jgi:hypothetical protein